MLRQRNKATNHLDPHPWKVDRAERVAQCYAFQAKDMDEARRWQTTLRQQLIRRLGGFPEEKVPLLPKELAIQEFPDYVQQKVRFHTRPGLQAFGYFLLPTIVNKPLPALLCLAGHGYGVDALIGLDAKGKPRENTDYHNNFALQAVGHGYAVLALEMLGFGHRREDIVEHIPVTSSCATLSGAALMMGETLAGWRVYEAIRALDYLETRPEVDAGKLGVMGISGGGLVGLFTAALDTRIQAAMISGYFNTFRDSVMMVPGCIDNFVPGLLRDAEMSDIAGLVAPRAIWCENGTDDVIYRVEPFLRACAALKGIYRVFGAETVCGNEVFEGPHSFHGKGAWPFLASHLKMAAEPHVL